MTNDHPMLFSTPMILALLREAKEPGTGKTQTRRIIKPQPHGRISMVTSFNHGRMEIAFGPDMRAKDGSPKWWRPLAQHGDRVWCRETWGGYHGAPTAEEFAGGVPVFYRADPEDAAAGIDRWRPSIHMPRWASRLTLYVSEVRVQRLQDISEADCIAEGPPMLREMRGLGPPLDGIMVIDPAQPHVSMAPRTWYRELWGRLNGPGSWDANPWVAAYSFRPVLGNIDTLPLEAAQP